MNNETDTEKFDLKLNQFGQIDVDYYHQKARALQAKVLAELFSSARKGISQSIGEFYRKYLCFNCPVSN